MYVTGRPCVTAAWRGADPGISDKTFAMGGRRVVAGGSGCAALRYMLACLCVWPWCNKGRLVSLDRRMGVYASHRILSLIKMGFCIEMDINTSQDTHADFPSLTISIQWMHIPCCRTFPSNTIPTNLLPRSPLEGPCLSCLISCLSLPKSPNHDGI